MTLGITGDTGTISWSFICCKVMEHIVLSASDLNKQVFTNSYIFCKNQYAFQV